jgi:hypothetical protein
LIQKNPLHLRKKRKRLAQSQARKALYFDWFGRKGAKGPKRAGLTVIRAGKIKRQEKRLVNLAVGPQVRSALNIPPAVPPQVLAMKKVKVSLGERKQKRKIGP